MTVPVSSLSIAVQGIADFLDGHFGEDVMITTDTPQRANDRVKGGDKHFLNLFTYRVMPSGFHAATAADEPYFIRINTLLTPFLADQGGSVLDVDLRILGHAIRVLHSSPIVPSILPGDSVDPADFRSQQHLNYQLQAVLQAPSMEELNHIWTTQGGELAYRLSAAYEFALIPIEPLQHASEKVPVTTSIIDTWPNMDVRDEKNRDDDGFIHFGDNVNTIPIGGRGNDNPPPATNWLPVVLFVDDGVLTNSHTVASGTATIDLSLAGLPGERVALEVSWVRADKSKDTQLAEVFTIASTRIDDPAAINSLALENAAEGDTATVFTRPVGGDDKPLPTSAYANTLLITVEA